MIAVPNLGHVGYVVEACIVLQLCRLVINLLTKSWAFGGFSGVVA